MDNIVFIHIIDQDSIVSENSPVNMRYEFDDESLTVICRFVDSLSIIVPLAIDKNFVLKVVSKILKDSSIENIVVNSPCTILSMLFSMDSLFVNLIVKTTCDDEYKKRSRLENGEQIVAYIESIQDRKVDNKIDFFIRRKHKDCCSTVL